MILVEKRRGVKIRIDGPDADGKNTCRALLVSDSDVDAVAEVIRRAIHAESVRELKAVITTPGGKQ